MQFGLVLLGCLLVLLGFFNTSFTRIHVMSADRMGFNYLCSVTHDQYAYNVTLFLTELAEYHKCDIICRSFNARRFLRLEI
jgi:hypothetical protein